MLILRKIFAFLFLFIFFESKAQYVFQKTFGHPNSSIGDFARDMAKDFSGDYYIGGNAFQGPIAVTKIDSLGNIIWRKAFGKFGGGVKQIIATKDSNIVLIGPSSLDSSFTNHLAIIKIDTAGIVLWSKHYLLDKTPNEMEASELPNGDLLIGVSNFMLDSTQTYYIYGTWVLKTDFDGNIKWVKNTLGPSNIMMYDLTYVNDNSYLMAGGIDSAGNTNSNAFIMEMDSMGDFKRAKLFYRDWDGLIFAQKVIALSNNNFILLTTDDNNPFPFYSYPHFIVVDSLWNQVINKEFQYPILYSPYSALKTLDGNFLITGIGFQLIKIDSLADIIWVMSNGITAQNKSTFKTFQTSDGGYFSMGTMFQTPDVFIFKTDSLGDAGCYSSTANGPLPFASPLVYDTLIAIGLQDTSLNFIVSDTVFNLPYDTTIWCFGYTGISESEADKDFFTVYPNPTSGNFNCFFNKSMTREKMLIEIYDAFGKMVTKKIKQPNENNTPINVSYFSPGIYFINLKSEDYLLHYNQKLIIQK